jgi:hypothetical protein
MKARGRLVCLVCAACVALALPASVSAKPGYFVSQPFRYAQAHMKGSHGYWLRIDAFNTNVDVSAKKGNAEVQYVAYRGRLRKDRVSAKLPGVGWVFLRFHEASRYRRKADNCEGPGALIRRGFFTGQVRIRGERDYTRVDAYRVRGKITQDVREACRRRPSARASGDPREETIFADAARGRGTLAFRAEKWPPEGGGFNALWFSAHLSRRRGPMSIGNSNYGFTEDTSAFAIAKSPLSATIDPPAPLTGSATFTQEGPDTFSWLGDLEVELPGIGPVALAGPSFSANLCIGQKCKGNADESIGFVRHDR